MFTLRQALKLPCFAKAHVVAGEVGLDQVIRRVHAVDMPNVVFAWGRGGLLLTTGYGLKDNPDLQATLVPKLVEQGLVGMVIAVGWYFAATPDVIKQAADTYGLPIIEMLPETEFITITERLYIEITNEQFALEKRSQDIHRQLTELVLKGGDLSAVAETLATILERSVLIESVHFVVLAASQVGPVDEARRAAMELGHTDDQLVQLLLQRGIYSTLLQKLRPIRLQAIPDLGFTMDRVVAPIVVGGEVFGYIWIVAGDRPLTDLDELAIDNAATVAALVLLKDQAVRESQQSARGDFLAELLRIESAPAPALAAQAHQIGYRFDQPHQVLFIARPVGAPGAGGHLAGLVEMWLQRLARWGLVVVRERGIAVVIESKTAAAGGALAEELIAAVHNPTALVVGVGQVCPPNRPLRRSYDQAVEAADIGDRLGGTPPLRPFWELGLLHWLYTLPPETLEHNTYYVKIKQLAEHDQRHHHDLVRTLEAYLEHGGSLIEAAGVLSIHRNSMVYRLGRIEELLNLDLKDPQQRLNLHVALKGYRLHE